MADSSGKLKGLREQMVAAAQALADERRSQTGSSPVPVHSSVSTKTTKPVIDGSALRTDERQRLARERREEKEKLNAARDRELIEKEKKAKLQYEKQMEEKQKKLEEQKQKDEQKRTAAEEKRKQKLLEEKERREANVRRTLERSSQLDHRQKRWSWGGSAEGDKQGVPGSSSPSPVNIIDTISSSTEPQPEDKSGPSANKRSASACNLKQADSVIHKRLSSSSATLLSSSEKGTKQRSSSLSRLSNKTPLSPQPPSPRVSALEKKGAGQKRSSSLSRLSNKKSSLLLEGVKKEETPASATTSVTPPSASKGPIRSRSIDRLKSPRSSTPGVIPTEPNQKADTEKQLPSSLGKRPSSPTVTLQRRSPSPSNVTKRAPSPTLEKRTSSSLAQKNRPPSPSVKQRPPSPPVPHKPVPIQRPSLTPAVLSATKKSTEPEAKPKEKSLDAISSEPKPVQTSEKETSKTKDESSNKSGSNTAEEAAKILAENRRFAREQREREEQERIQRQEEEKIKQEEMARIAEEEKQRLKEEAILLEEKRKLEREEEERIAQEEKLLRDLEEQDRLVELQQQREEAEAKALEEAEKQRLEREKIMQQNMQERLERKKRIEEIMKRTRKTDQMDVKGEDRSEEDDEIGSLEKDLDGTVNGVDLCDDTDDPGDLEETPAPTSPHPVSQDTAVVTGNELFINGDRTDIDQKLNGHSSETAPAQESSQMTNDSAILSQDQSHLNEDDRTGDSVTNLNGKSGTWTFEEIINLGIHSKTTSLSDSISTDSCNQDLIEPATVPPKLAFEEGRVNSLSTAIESAAEM
ncbi:MAP7 domain-containing protein 3 isoform X8 [Pseudophryne corroboree]|uniref:MAP7 domain-containing protein 3 isoform X8 n=1 Tax=Pseudophryne corroboree TaxID=495146 RepID=UPI00308156A5